MGSESLEQEAPKSPTTKRLRSTSPRPEAEANPASKRPRLSDGSADSPGTVRASPPPVRKEPELKQERKEDPPKPTVPDKRKYSIQEEKKRGQRLFGGLLSVLGQRPAEGAQNRRLEIEKRQKEKAEKLAADNKAREAEKLARLNEVRRKQQVKFDEQAVCLLDEWRGRIRANRT